MPLGTAKLSPSLMSESPIGKFDVKVVFSYIASYGLKNSSIVCTALTSIVAVLLSSELLC